MVVKTLNDFKNFCESLGADPLELLWETAERNQRLLDQAIIRIRGLSTEDKSIFDIKEELKKEISKDEEK